MNRISLCGLVLVLGGQFVVASAQPFDDEPEISPSTSLQTSSISPINSSSSYPVTPTATSGDLLDPTDSLGADPSSTKCTCALQTALFPTVPCSGSTTYVASDPPTPTYITVTETLTVDYNVTTAPPTFITPMPRCSTFVCPSNECYTRPLMPGDDVIEITQKTTVQGPSPTEEAPSFDDDDDEEEGEVEEDDGGHSNDEDEGESDSDSKPEPAETEDSDHPSDAPSETQNPDNPNPTITSPPSSNDDGSGDVSPRTTIITLNDVPVTIIDPAKSIIVGNTDAERITITQNDIFTTFTANGREWTVNPSEIICSDSTMIIDTNSGINSTPSASADEGTITTATASSGGSTDNEDGNEDDSGNGGDNDDEDGTTTGSTETSKDSNPNFAASITGSDLKISLAFGTITAFVFGGMFGIL